MLTDLSSDSLDEVVQHTACAIAEPLVHYRTHMTLGLLCLALRQRFVLRWTDTRTRRLIQRIAASYKHARCMTEDPVLANQLPLLKLGSLDERHCNMLMGATNETRALWRYTQFLFVSAVSAQTATHATEMCPSDYATVEPTLQVLQRFWSLLANHERLEVVWALLRYALYCRRNRPVTLAQPGKSTRVDKLFIYQPPAVIDPVCVVQGHDVRGLIPLSVAELTEAEGPVVRLQTYATMLNKSALKHGIPHYWAERLRTMAVLRAPLQRFQSIVEQRRPRVMRKNSGKRGVHGT